MMIRLLSKKLTLAVSLMLISMSGLALADTAAHQLTQPHQAQQIITTDWSIAETLLMFDAPLVGIGDVMQYKNWVVTPRISDKVIDLGLRSQPNMEALIEAQANTLINSSWFQHILPPELINNRYTLHAVDFYTDEGLSWHNTVTQTLLLGKISQREAEAQALVAKVATAIATDRRHLDRFADRPIAMVQFIDARHLRIYGNNSLYGVVLNKLSLHNAWQQATNGWGFKQINLLDLANLPPSTLLIIIAPYPANLAEKLRHNPLWLQLPFANKQNYRVLPAVWAFGALPSMQRFSHLLTDSLLDPPHYAWPDE
ncbi:ABC transporter substrate-binding protein [Orbus sturtevantii]|uniref:ABC transporter substrate-binding protein n=1 Tax=Orbus sturtevantii TaxID=3074109 RepID=UPI00370DD99A